MLVEEQFAVVPAGRRRELDRVALGLMNMRHRLRSKIEHPWFSFLFRTVCLTAVSMYGLYASSFYEGKVDDLIK